MADTGSGILGYLNPDLLAAQRRQALAQMLLQKGSQAPDQKNPYSGLTDAGNMLLGAYLLKKSDQDMSSAYQGMMGGDGSGSAPTSPPAAPTQAMAPGGDMFAMPNSSAPMAPVPGSAPAPSQTFSPSGQNAPPQQGVGQPPQGGEGRAPIDGYLDQVIPQMPGMPPMARMERWNISQNPDQYKVYLDNYMKYYQPTDAMKQVGATLDKGMASPYFPEKMAKLVAKESQMSPIPSGSVVPDPSKPPSQWMTTTGRTGLGQRYNPETGSWDAYVSPEAAAAIQTKGRAESTGPASVKNVTGYDRNGNPIATDQLTMSGNPNPWKSGPTPSPVAPAPGGGAAPPAAPGGGGAPLMPELPQGQGQLMGGQGTALNQRLQALQSASDQAKDNMFYLDHAYDLSKKGTPTGPAQEAIAEFKGMVGGFFPGSKWSQDASNFQTIQKNTMQYGQGAWAAAGGTGTDTQLEARMHTVPNVEMNPEAFQTIALYAKAGEQALLAKRQAMQNWANKNGNTVPSLNQFETTWNSALDRRVFYVQQLAQKDPKAAQAYVNAMSPHDKQVFNASVLALDRLGALQ